MYKPTRYYVTEKARDDGLLLMSTLNSTYLKFSSPYTDKVSTLLKTPMIPEEQVQNDPVLSILKQYQFIFNTSYDESLAVDVMHKSHVYSDKWLYLTILPTNNCNFRCVYCYETPEPQYMSDQTEKNILDFCRKNVHRYQFVRLNWFGGEPLLEKERVLRISKELDKICREYGVPLIGLMSTNGYELDVDTFRALISYRILSYQICLDGDRCTHNVQRPHYVESDSYERVLNNLIAIQKQVRSRTYKIGIRANMTPFVEEHMQEHLERLSQYFAGD